MANISEMKRALWPMPSLFVDDYTHDISFSLSLSLSLQISL